MEENMKLSIFEKAKHLPIKEEKGREARFTSKPYKPEIVEVITKDDLIKVLTSKCWSPFIFTEFRREDNFISTDFLVYDIDEGQKIEDVEKIVQDLNLICLVLPTTSHTSENHRFRVVLPLSKTITKADSYKATYAKMAEYFNIDPACSDLARFYFGSTMDDGFWYSHGKLLDPVVLERVKKAAVKRYESKEAVVVGESIEELVMALYGEPRSKIPDNIAYWLEEAPNGLDGEWFLTCNSAIFTLGLLDINLEIVENVFRKIAPEELDSSDEYLLNRAWEDGNNARDEEL